MCMDYGMNIYPYAYANQLEHTHTRTPTKRFKCNRRSNTPSRPAGCILLTWDVTVWVDQTRISSWFICFVLSLCEEEQYTYITGICKYINMFWEKEPFTCTMRGWLYELIRSTIAIIIWIGKLWLAIENWCVTRNARTVLLIIMYI